MKARLETLQKQLALMQEVVSQCQRRVFEDGTLYILWGLLAVVASVLVYVVGVLRFPEGTQIIIWIAVFALPGFVLTYRTIRNRKRHVATFGDKILIRLWLGVWFLLSCLFIFQALPGVPWQIITMIPFSFGLVYFPLALLLDWEPLTVFALLWMGSGAAMLFIPPPLTYFVLDLAILICQVFPGILLKLRFRKQLANAD